MADNVIANAGSGGATFKTDDDGTAHWPYTKMVFGADDTRTRVSDTDPLPTDMKEYGSTAVGAGNAVHVQPGTAASFTVAQTTATNLKASVEQATAASLKAQTDAQGRAAHDAPVSGNPVLVGVEARTTNPTAVGNGDAVRAQADSAGKQVVLPGAVHEFVVSGELNVSNTTPQAIIAAGGAGVKTVITSVMAINASATVATKVEIRDGATVEIPGYCAINGGGFTLAPGTPLFVGTANTAVNVYCATTGADVEFFVSGYQISN